MAETGSLEAHALDVQRARLLWALRMRALSHDPDRGGFRENEAATVAALSIVTGQMFERAVSGGDWVGVRDRLVYDACSPSAHRDFDFGRFVASLRDHLFLKQGVHRVVIDLRVDGVDEALIRRIGAHVRGLDRAAQRRVIALCRNETDRAAYLG